jgi:ABC-type phosphate transport system substrate-binding protein
MTSMSKTMSRTTLLRLALAALLLSAGAVWRPAAAADGYKLIVHPSNPVDSLPREQVARLFLKKVTSWSGGKAVAPVDRDKDAPPRAAFSHQVLHKSVAEVTNYWQQQIFAGRAVPPAEKRTDAEVVAFVEQEEGAIGNVSADASTVRAKVVGVED